MNPHKTKAGLETRLSPHRLFSCLHSARRSGSGVKVGVAEIVVGAVKRSARRSEARRLWLGLWCAGRLGLRRVRREGRGGDDRKPERERQGIMCDAIHDSTLFVIATPRYCSIANTGEMDLSAVLFASRG